jgi:hypothetical protein
MSSNKTEINEFLLQVNKILNKSNSFQLIPRRKNLDAIYRIGLSIDSVKEYIKNLTLRDYCEGPKKDENGIFSGEVWVFGKKINNILFYIKLKIKDNQLLCCLSFHDAEYNMIFPFK